MRYPKREFDDYGYHASVGYADTVKQDTPIRRCDICGAPYIFRNRDRYYPGLDDICENCYSVVRGYTSLSKDVIAHHLSEELYQNERIAFRTHREEYPDMDPVCGWSMMSTYAVIG